MTADVFADAMLCAQLVARDPVGLGGMVLRGAGPARDAVVDELRRLLPSRKLPVGIDDEGLIGGRDLTATLAGRGGVVRRGLLSDASGGLIVVPMAERMSDAIAARIAAAMDSGEVVVERDGIAARDPTGFGLILLDDGRDDERAPDRLSERVAFSFDLSTIAPQEWSSIENPTTSGPKLSRDEALASLAAASLALGIDSVRGPIFAYRAACLLAENDAPGEDHLAKAARLVLAHRAKQRPPSSEDGESEPPPPPPDMTGQSDGKSAETLDDMVLDAVRASLPPEVLAALANGSRRKSTGSGAGQRRKSPTRGRPLGARAGLPRGGARLSLIDTLRAAAPWQKLRGAEGRIAIRRDDLRIKRFETRADATTIFAVDASGSAAVSRLAEAKGAVELLLAEAYVKRTEVALIAFRGTGADVLLPPTRSLTRARRSLGDLPGGGGTPLAAGIDAARRLGEAIRSKGRTPFVVLLSDGRGNVAIDGSTVAVTAKGDADRAARSLAATGIDSVFIDISARLRPEGLALATAMGARYLPLPRADAAKMRDAVVQATPR